VAPVLDEDHKPEEESVSEQSRVMTSAVVGALVGAAAGYLFFTERGRMMRDRLEPAMDDLRQEFGRFQRTIEKVGEMASEGMRVVQEFNAARSQSQYPTDGGTSH
jgi:gas vesicle protein